MTVKTKGFDCVEMKRECQRKLHEEYEARKGEFASYYDFVEVKAKESEFGKRIRAKIAGAGTGETS